MVVSLFRSLKWTLELDDGVGCTECVPAGQTGEELTQVATNSWRWDKMGRNTKLNRKT